MAYLIKVAVGQELPTTTDGNKVIVHEPFDFRKTVLTGVVFSLVVAFVNKALRGFNGVSCRKTGK